jgi:hypothetical protein
VDGLLRAGDVILEVGGARVDHAGKVVVDGQAQELPVILDRYQIGELLPIRIWRSGTTLDLRVPLKADPERTRFSHQWDRLPQYCVVGGLVFVELDLELLKTFGSDWQDTADRTLVWAAYFEPLSDYALYSRHRVLLLRRLDHPVNVRMAWHRHEVVDRINGREIREIRDVIEAFESNRDAFHVIEFLYQGRVGVLEREAVERANPEILRRYGIREDRRF